MLVRVTGANSGIVDYLRDGIKHGRDFTREDLDQRVILDGDLDLTDNIIKSIPNNKQDRYLHITLSFRESEVDQETLNNVVDEYKSLLMTAYKNDEYNFYAEAHLPKIKYITDRKTGEQVERKPHIHIVIPKKNLLTNGFLNPVGLYEKNIKYFDAIQEHINKKYNLESPKDFVRDTENNYAHIISRIKGDLYLEKNGKFKTDLIKTIEKEDIRTYQQFTNLLEGKGEVKVRNKGKLTEYLAVKLEGSNKFINLKSPLFSRDFIEQRKVLPPRLTDKEISQYLDQWQSTISKEIKHIDSANPEFRKNYRKLSFEDQQQILQERVLNYDRKYRDYDSRDYSDYGDGYFTRDRNISRDYGSYRDTGHFIDRPNIESYTKAAETRHFGQITEGLPSVPQWNVVSTGERTGQPNIESTEMLLPPNESFDLVNRSTIQYRSLRRGDLPTQAQNDNVIAQITKDRLETTTKEAELKYFADIRKNLKPDLLLEQLQRTHGLTGEFNITVAKDGSPRIGEGSKNYNVSDFLTKKMNLTWREAKQILITCYEKQEQQTELTLSKGQRMDIKHNRPNKRLWIQFKNEYLPYVGMKIKQENSEIRRLQKELWAEVNNNYYNRKDAIWKRDLTREARRAAHSINIMSRLKEKELCINHINSLRDAVRTKYFKDDKQHYIDFLVEKYEEKKDMAILDELKKQKALDQDTPSLQRGDVKDLTIASTIDMLKKQAELLEEQKKRLELNDIFASRTNSKGFVEYKTKDGENVFIDKGEQIVFDRSNQTEEKILLGLQLAIGKYGEAIKVTGSEEFKQKLVEVVAKNGLHVYLTPEKYNELVQERIKELSQERAMNKEHKDLALTNLAKESSLANSQLDKFKDLIYKTGTLESERQRADLSTETTVIKQELERVTDKLKELTNNPNTSTNLVKGYELYVNSLEARLDNLSLQDHHLGSTGDSHGDPILTIGEEMIIEITEDKHGIEEKSRNELAAFLEQDIPEAQDIANTINNHSNQLEEMIKSQQMQQNQQLKEKEVHIEDDMDM